ncbi:uncharacterized protein LOC141907325 [Tubulanus polymorphus]|uniref:uncharacterized protein LOC141907325 n=1 Tax=Tubulanus polymorphus TaxID=672921 RepID=UPI003DA6B45F
MPSKVHFEKLAQHDDSSDQTATCPERISISSDDDEDEIYIRDNNHDPSLSRPLMYPRKPRTKVKVHNAATFRRVIKPILFTIAALAFSIALIIVVKYIVKSFRKHLQVQQAFLAANSIPSNAQQLIGCSNIQVTDVWIRGIPKFITESAIRNVDINGDGVLDHLVAFGTGAVNEDANPLVCNIYFDGSFPCFGGILALNGITGEELWRYYSREELFGLNCNIDFNRDGVFDCLGGGRAGAFSLVSGRDGKEIWTFDAEKARRRFGIMNLYTAQAIKDYNGDGIPEVLAIHGGDPLREPGSKLRLAGRLIIFSGADGEVLRAVTVPDRRESYYSPQIHTLLDGTQVVLFGTGGETHPGSFWYIGLDDLYRGNVDKAQKVYSDKFKGVMTPPVLIDLNGDFVEDIVLPIYNSTTIAFDGKTFEPLWKYHVPWSESYSTPAVGYFNDDAVPDFMVHWQIGPGYPIYYHSITTILDGKTGKPLIDPIRDSVGAQASPLTVSVEGHGNDIFLYWIADCQGHEREGGEFTFINGTNIHEQSRSDFCRLRFKSSGFSKMYAISKNVKSPGVKVYYSVERKDIEKASWVNTTKQGLDFVEKHPEHLRRYLKFAKLSKIDMMNKPINKLERVDYGHDDEADLADDFSEEDANYLNELLKKYGADDEDNDLENIAPPRHEPSLNRHRPYPHQSNIGRISDHDGIPGRRKIDYRRRRPSYRRRRSTHSGRQGSRANDFRKTTKIEDYLKNARGNELKSEAERVDMNDMMRDENIRAKIENHLNRDRDALAKKLRKKRHLGPHDDAGLQRLLSTGTLAPSLLQANHPDFNHSIDLVFATYWFFPAKTQTLLPADQKCIDDFMAQEMRRFNPKSKYFHMDRDAYNHAAEHECLEKSGNKVDDKHGTYQSQTSYNPYNLLMGQMTVYRMRITCNCKGDERMKSPGARCSRVLPYKQQEWAGYMGTYGDSHWNPRSKTSS